MYENDTSTNIGILSDADLGQLAAHPKQLLSSRDDCPRLCVSVIQSLRHILARVSAVYCDNR